MGRGFAEIREDTLAPFSAGPNLSQSENAFADRNFLLEQGLYTKQMKGLSVKG
jgi:hypothetical protein